MGDTLALYVIHDQKALEEANEKAYLGKDIYYDHSDAFLSLVRHEALYSAYILTKDFDKIDTSKCIEIKNLAALPENIELYNKPNKGVIFNNKHYSYGVCLFNKWCGFKEIQINQIINKTNNNFLSGKVWENANDDVEGYYRQLNHLEKNLFFYISITNHFPPTINIDEMIDMSGQVEELASKIPDNIELGYLINQALIKRCLENFGKKESTLLNLFKSGSRFSEKQLARSCVNIGFVADSENQIHPTAFNTNLLKGLSEKEFFASSSGTRKGISDKSKSTPSSGYLERSLAMGLSAIEITEEDCGTDTCLEVTIINQKHISTLIDKWYKLNLNDPEWKVLKKENDLKPDQKIFVRSPIFCQTKNLRICKKCWGEKNLSTKYIGILAGQILAERFTQLSLRSFHDSGSAVLDIDKTLLTFIKDHLIDIVNSDTEIQLIFDSDLIPAEFTKVPNYKYNLSTPTPKEQSNIISYGSVVFDYVRSFKQNKDPVEGLQRLREIIKAKSLPNILTPTEYYHELMKNILEVGSPYSSFVECLFANMFLTSKDGDIWRYNQTSPIIKKLGDKTLASQISPLLNLLYQQNQKTVENIEFLGDYIGSDETLTIYEKLFLEKF